MKAKMTFQELAQYIMEYESDTFSAEASKITEDEAWGVVMRLTAWLANERIDGVLLSELLDEERDQ